MLKGIPQILSPELLKALCEMGHGDYLVIADGNFPAQSVGKDTRVIRCDGHGVPELLQAILKVIPTDTYVEHPVNLMAPEPQDPKHFPIWDTIYDIVERAEGKSREKIGYIERFAFYEESKKAFAVIATGEQAVYANVMLQKGVITPDMLTETGHGV